MMWVPALLMRLGWKGLKWTLRSKWRVAALLISIYYTDKLLFAAKNYGCNTNVWIEVVEFCPCSFNAGTGDPPLPFKANWQNCDGSTGQWRVTAGNETGRPPEQLLYDVTHQNDLVTSVSAGNMLQYLTWGVRIGANLPQMYVAATDAAPGFCAIATILQPTGTDDCCGPELPAGGYDCINDTCTVVQNGQWQTLAECQQNCININTYGCVFGECVSGAGNQDLATCQLDCQGYECNAGECIQTPTGSQTLQACQENCGNNYACDDEGNCGQSSLGTQTLAECEEDCEPEPEEENWACGDNGCVQSSLGSMTQSECEESCGECADKGGDEDEDGCCAEDDEDDENPDVGCDDCDCDETPFTQAMSAWTTKIESMFLEARNFGDWRIYVGTIPAIGNVGPYEIELDLAGITQWAGLTDGLALYRQIVRNWLLIGMWIHFVMYFLETLRNW